MKKVRPTGAAFVSNKHVYFISALHMRPFRELYMYLCVARQGDGGGALPQDIIWHADCHEFDMKNAFAKSFCCRSL